MNISQAIVEQHIHGAFGYDFMTCSVDDFKIVSKKLLECGVGYYFPTIMTADFTLIKERIQIVKKAMEKQQNDVAQIAGVHLEGPFINPTKQGIHETKYIQPLDKKIYQELEDDVIKIVTLAPELDIDLVDYLKLKNVKLSAGHCISTDLSKMNQVTHLYNAMGTFTHRGESTVVKALNNEDIMIEIIADSMHICDEVLNITFKLKDMSKMLLISDALPLAHSKKREHIFAGQTIYNRNGKLVSKDGVFAGSSKLICDIVKNLVDKNIIQLEDAFKCASSNQLKYHNLKNNLNVYWNESNLIEKVELI